jgi:hypothetical protein
MGEGPTSRIRTGHVATPYVDAARTADKLPSRGDKHPTDSELTCDDIQFESNGAYTNVTIYYSDSGTFRGTTLLKKKDGYYKWLTVIPRRADIEIPMNKRALRTISQPNNAPDVKVKVFEIAKFPVPHVFKIWPLEVYCRVLDRNQLNIHANMLDHIHTIHAVDLKFLGMVNYREEGNKWYTITYHWEQDPGTPTLQIFNGTPLPGDNNLPPIAFLPPYNRDASTRYHRLPYENLTTQESLDPRTNYHATLGFISLEKHATEWRQLPGVPVNL